MPPDGLRQCPTVPPRAQPHDSGEWGDPGSAGAKGRDATQQIAEDFSIVLWEQVIHSVPQGDDQHPRPVLFCF